MINLLSELKKLQHQLQGELYFDELLRSLYATDASVYRMMPLAVAVPKSESDIVLLIKFASKYNTSIIPRTAGTSLAGQCVGEGIVVDVSKYFTKIIDFNETKRTVTLQPGVVRDHLNLFLEPYGLFFGPNTSTSNRCMLGGMVGNNSSGTTSIKYGVTRDKVLELKAILSDGSAAHFKNLTVEEVNDKVKLNSLEGHIYRTVCKTLSLSEVKNEINTHFPKPEIHRRNTGYAIDSIIASNYFGGSQGNLNLCSLLTGSEGTLAFTTEITLQLDLLPPRESAMVCLHFNSIEQCLNAVQGVMKHNLYACEMMDKTILELTKHNKTQQENRSFIDGQPEAVLMCELRAANKEALEELTDDFLRSVDQLKLSYAAPILTGEEIHKATELRKAGLGLLGNMIGDKKAVACIEDTAVALSDLANYISEFTELMKSYGQEAVYYAHAGAGELHLRPILDLKKSGDVHLFRKITTDVAYLVKKYKGSLSGEHGDGIVRGEFLPYMIGEKNYEVLKQIKGAFDPQSILNPGKIVEAYPMDNNLRYQPDLNLEPIETILDFSESLGILREAEKCNGSGDCRKLPEFGGTMCPSYRATRNEKDTTRARANALREFLTHSNKANKFDHLELKEVFDLCLSCKACASECPSSVDVSALKAEFLYQYQKTNGVSLRTKLFAHNNTLNKYFSNFPRVYNAIVNHGFISKIVKWTMGIAPQRSLPKISTKRLNNYLKNTDNQIEEKKYFKTIILFIDEFTNYLDTQIGIDALQLLDRLNYKVRILNNFESGRALISKGLLEEAKKQANNNVLLYKDIVSSETPLVGIEPSAILTFRDEYLKLADDRESARSIAKNTLLIEEFVQNEIRSGNISSDQFTQEHKVIKFHGHCHQKALINQKSSFDMLNLPKNFKVTIIPSGCCGMAGSFGYEKEHYDISMNIGEQTLFPSIRRADPDTIIAANGTSCRHQIKDGTQRDALHPVTVMKNALA